jgi:transcriptional regulator with XRE-family HTH domain|nr:MAG TPA: Cro/C1-type HTH DNA-binding domain protein [Caudoviricetes sp.]DAP46429.1 MAG TPA: Cro/C1-type HTH DNA-binding domain protein [Caudoviricetes sp.]
MQGFFKRSRNFSKPYNARTGIMANLYENIEKLCKQRGVNVTTMCKESGASRGSLTDLKNGRKQTLKYETLDKIASYFGTSVDTLVSGEQKENPPQQPQSEVDAAVERIRKKLESMPKEQREALMNLIEKM